MLTWARVSVMKKEVHSFSQKNTLISSKLKSRHWGAAVGLACLLTCTEQHTAAVLWQGEGWLQAAGHQNRDAVRNVLQIRKEFCFWYPENIFDSRLSKVPVSSPNISEWLKLHKQNKAGLFDSIRVLGLVKFTIPIFFLKRVRDEHLQKAPKECDGHFW